MVAERENGRRHRKEGNGKVLQEEAFIYNC